MKALKLSSSTFHFLLLLTFLILNLATQANAMVLTYPGLSSNENSGYSVSKLGDINGDGYDDIISGAFGYDSERGRVHIYLGGEVSNIVPDITLTGENPGDRFGWAVSGAGDFNDDGLMDIIVGADGYNNFTGRAYIYFGRTDGIITAPSVIINGEFAGNHFGYSVSGAGTRSAYPYPLNDDFEDVMIGAYGWDGDLHTEPNKGRAYLVLGRIVSSPPLIISAVHPENYIFQGEAEEWYFGNSVAYGEFNNSPHTELIVGAPGYNDNTGRAYLYWGNGDVTYYEGTQQDSYFGAAVSDAGDVDGNGFDDIVIGAGGIQVGPDYVGRVYIFAPSNNGAVTITGETDPLGGFGSVASFGDLDGDNFSDIGVGAYSFGGFRGKAYIFKGRSDFFTYYNNYTALPFDAFATGDSPGDGFGASISGAGNFDCDLTPDYIVGSPYKEDNLTSDAGALILYHSSDCPLPVELTSFTSNVNGNIVLLKWSTASEINNLRFDVERRDARGETQDVWSRIGFVNGNGTSTHPNNYEFNDIGLSSGKYNYRLKQIDYNGNYEYYNLSNEVVIGAPDKFSLSQNYPNPFNPVTNLEFGISNLEFVSLKVYDLLGKEVATIVNENLNPGTYKFSFDGSNFESGVYFYKITAGNFTAVKRMILLK